MSKFFKKIAKVNDFQFHVSLLGRLIYYIWSPKKEIIEKNIDIVFSNKFSTIDKKKFIQGFYSHVLLSIKEILIMLFFSSIIRQQYKIIGKENLINEFKKNKGIILLAPHLGNFVSTNYKMIPLSN